MQGSKDRLPRAAPSPHHISCGTSAVPVASHRYPCTVNRHESMNRNESTQSNMQESKSALSLPQTCRKPPSQAVDGSVLRHLKLNSASLHGAPPDSGPREVKLDRARLPAEPSAPSRIDLESLTLRISGPNCAPHNVSAISDGRDQSRLCDYNNKLSSVCSNDG